jgi:hypothetical protein
VPLTKLEEVQSLVIKARSRMLDIPLAVVRCDDILYTSGIALQNKRSFLLSQELRAGLITSLQACIAEVCSVGWDWYLMRDVPLTEETKPILRQIVAQHWGVETPV